jgi:hypothetical protein
MKICALQGCRNKYLARGYCGQHVQKLYKYGDPTARKYERHGLKNTPEYNAWSRMIARCSNPKNPKYSIYGERGIIVCSRWRKSFTAFYQDMGIRPAADYSLDRINVNGNYEPNNCRWATQETQANNRRKPVKQYTYGNTSQSLPRWAKQYGISYKLLWGRINRYGMPIEKALNL